MKLVYVAFDNVSHQPKSTDIFSMNKCNDFKIESSYIAKVCKQQYETILRRDKEIKELKKKIEAIRILTS